MVVVLVARSSSVVEVSLVVDVAFVVGGGGSRVGVLVVSVALVLEGIIVV